MNQEESAEQRRDRHLRVLGPDLGPIYHQLQSDLTGLHVQWQEYRTLYRDSSERVDLLNHTAGLFFSVVQDVLWENTLLQIARLTDKRSVQGNDTLSIEAIPKLLGDHPQVSSDKVFQAEVSALVDAAVRCCAFTRPWRDRRLAHRDLSLATETPKVNPLPPVKLDQVDQALASLVAVLNCVRNHFTIAEWEYDGLLAPGDAKALVDQLAIAARDNQRRHDRLSQDKALPEDFERPPAV